MKYQETPYGFQYGPVTVERCMSDHKKGWVVLTLTTDKKSVGTIQVYVTKTGKVRIADSRGEWTPPSV